MKSIAALDGHVILCGYGRFGRVVVDELVHNRVPLVVVDIKQQAPATTFGPEAYYLAGSALEDEVLEAAGTRRARAIVICTPNDSDNVFVALSARELNPEITIHARAETDSGARRLRQAGAEQVISPHHLGGQRVANALVRPTVLDFLELSAPGTGTGIDLEEVALAPACRLHGTTIRNLSDHGVHVAVVAIRRAGEAMRLTPGPDDILQAHDHVVVVGARDQLIRLAQLASPPTP